MAQQEGEALPYQIMEIDDSTPIEPHCQDPLLNKGGDDTKPSTGKKAHMADFQEDQAM
jgi:hypothetical protein